MPEGKTSPDDPPAGNEPFPLVRRALEHGVLGEGRWLVVAPTATGKSHLARLVVRETLLQRESGLRLYLVPYRALARQVYEDLEQDLSELEGTRLRIATGDATDPVDAVESDVVVATYERAVSIVSQEGLELNTGSYQNCTSSRRSR